MTFQRLRAMTPMTKLTKAGWVIRGQVATHLQTGLRPMAWLVKLRKLREQYAQHRPQSQAMCKHNSVSEERGQPSKAYTQPPAHTVNASRLLGSVCPPQEGGLPPSLQKWVSPSSARTSDKPWYFCAWLSLRLAGSPGGAVSVGFSAAAGSNPMSGLSAEVHRGLWWRPAG